MRFVLAWLLLFPASLANFTLFAQHRFIIDLNNINEDQFKVTMIPDKLSEDNDIFQFASIAPGTYQIMDIGRFVRAFHAYDTQGQPVHVEQLSTNQWKLSDPEVTARIEYSIAETWDTPVEEHPIYRMCGTSLEEDHALINNHAVLGYIHGMQSHELWIRILHPDHWITGTALTQNNEGYYTAPSYDFVVDSPILLGRLDKASIMVEDTKVDIFTYSKTDLIKSGDILDDLEDILYAASRFTDGLPVDRYVFLYHFEDGDYGAWEHSYSSIYAMKEAEFDPVRTQMFRSIAAHEFYHIVTPLNIHSELIENFNYVRPELSQHLWLYEGVTEWAAEIMLLRDQIYTLEDYLADVRMKLQISDAFDPDISLTELGINATNLADQYVNIYNKGAMTATMLDLLLLKKSKGKRGLRELVNQLSLMYGPDKPFDENTFFDRLEELTYPEIGEFIDNYIKGSQPLPLKEYFDFIGIEYKEFAGYDSTSISLDLGMTVVGEDIVVSKTNEYIKEIEKGDVLYKMDGIEITLSNLYKEYMKIQQRNVGDLVKFVFLRHDKEIEVDYILPPQKISHQLEVSAKPKRRQLKLRDKWLTNL